MKLVTIVVCICILNIAWAIIFGIRDHLQRNKKGEVVTNLQTATRNIKCSVINIVLVIILMLCRSMNIYW